jgi:hypothetical protein
MVNALVYLLEAHMLVAVVNTFALLSCEKNP